MEVSLVSVIVPTRNSARTLRACLQSVRAQTHIPIELIVVDNNSTDNTVEIARASADFVETAGPERSAQRNRGARLAAGDYFLFVDSDMVLEPDVIADCVRTIMARPAGAVVIPELSSGEGFWARCRALERSCYAGDDLVEAPRFFRRGVFERSGGFDEQLTGPEDWDLAIRTRGSSAFPRTSTRIIHDEGRAALSGLLAKKFYYARSFPAYWKKHGGVALKQANTVARPAFIKNWKRLIANPTLAGGLVVLKVLELSASIAGVVLVLRAPRRPTLRK